MSGCVYVCLSVLYASPSNQVLLPGIIEVVSYLLYAYTILQLNLYCMQGMYILYIQRGFHKMIYPSVTYLTDVQCTLYIQRCQQNITSFSYPYGFDFCCYIYICISFYVFVLNICTLYMFHILMHRRYILYFI